MKLKDLYGFVLLFVLVGMLLGAGILALDKFGSASGVTADASTAINETRDAIADVPTTWLPIIVVIAMVGLILVIVIKSFGGAGSR